MNVRKSLVVWWLGLSALTSGALGLIPVLGTKIPQAMQPNKEKANLILYVCFFQLYHLPFQHSSYLLRYVSLITVFRVIFQPLRLEVLIAQMLNHLCLTAVSVHFLILGDFFLILKSIPLLASNS